MTLSEKKGPPARFPLVKQNPPVTYYWGAEIDRETAHSLGRIRYFTGEPCIWGHVDERWVSSGTCIQCKLQRHRTPEYREYVHPVHQAWVADNPDRVDSYNAQRRAVKAAKPVKSEARREGNRMAWERRKQNA